MAVVVRAVLNITVTKQEDAKVTGFLGEESNDAVSGSLSNIVSSVAKWTEHAV